MTMEVKEGDLIMLGEENQAAAGVGEKDSENIWEARYSNVRFSKNMTREELLESLKHLTGPGAEDEKKRRVIKWTQTEKGRRQAAEAQARNMEKKERKIERIKEIQMQRGSKMVRDAQRAERRGIAEERLRWDAEYPEEAAKRREDNKGARKRAAKKAKKRLLAESQNAREVGFPATAERKIAESGATRSVREGAVEADAMSDVDEMADDDTEVDIMKGLGCAKNPTFTLAIRGK